jgi:putative NADH-flavin reductase
MRIAVFGATGGTGRAVIKEALGLEYTVTAFARDASKIAAAEGVTVLEDDVMKEVDVAPVLVGQDAVIVSLGNSQNPFAMLVGARRTTPRDVCEIGTRNILGALPKGSQTPIIVVGAFGTGDTREQLPFMFKLFYRLFLREQMADKERQDTVLRGSDANYTLIQPVALTDKPGIGTWTTSVDGTIGKSEVGRSGLAQYLMSLCADGKRLGETVTFSG